MSRLGVHGADRHGEAGLARGEGLDEVEAVGVAGGEVDDGHGGGLVGGGGLAADEEVGVGVDEVREAAADEGVVVDEEDGGAGGCGARLRF